MYAYITGIVTDKNLNAMPLSVVVDNQGIGYRLFVAARDWKILPSSNFNTHPDDKDAPQQGNANVTYKFYIYTHRQEDEVNLYGFLNKIDGAFFVELLKVQGVGPKLALKIIGEFSSHQVAGFIQNGNIDSLCAVSGLGKKTASKMVLELKNNMKPYLTTPERKDISLAEAIASTGSDATTELALTPTFMETKEALFKLSYKENEIAMVLRKLLKLADEENLDTTEKLIKKALYLLSKTHTS